MNEEKITVESWKAQLLELFKKGGVSMVEIMRLPRSAGRCDLMLGENDSLLLWHGMAQELVEALAELLHDKVITVHSTSTLVYFIDGAVLRMPVAKSPKRHYKRVHWLPVTFNLERSA